MFEAFLAERRNQPFGDVESVTDRTLNPFSTSLQTAAGNLLDKALRALVAGDEARANAFVARACALPFDDHEKSHPAAEEATMALFNIVVDALEESSEMDSGWLDAAGAAAAGADEAARTELANALLSIEQDYDLTRTERAHIIALAATLPQGPELRELRLPADELAGRVLSVLTLCRDYAVALSAD